MFEFETHVARTAGSVRLMCEAELLAHSIDKTDASNSNGVAIHPTDIAEIAIPELLRPHLLRAFSRAVSHYDDLYARTETLEVSMSSHDNSLQQQPAAQPSSSNHNELKLTLLVIWGPKRVEEAYEGLGKLFHEETLRRKASDLAHEVCSTKTSSADSSARDSASRSSSVVPWVLVTHVKALPPRRAPPVRVLIAGAPRSNASAKDSVWVRQRQALEAMKGQDVEEVLLSAPPSHAAAGEGSVAYGGAAAASEAHNGRRGGGGGGAIFEGTQTNFFAIKGGTVHTAPDGAVLSGTVRRLVLEVCAREGFPVSFEPPSVDDVWGIAAAAAAAAADSAQLSSSRSASEATGRGGASAPSISSTSIVSTPSVASSSEGVSPWEAAFLTSTSRLVLPIDEVILPLPASAAADAAVAALPEGRATAERIVVPIPSSSSALLRRIEALVAAEIAAHSTKLEL